MTALPPPFHYPAAWTRTDRAVLDVAILGGGQSGLAIWHGLRLAGIDNVAIFDAARPGSQGIWQTVARMRTLRTEKTITGPEHGNPDLSFPRWVDATHGAGTFASLGQIPRLLWQAYLDGFARAIGARPQWSYRLIGVAPGRAGLDLHFRTDEGERVVQARHLVVATGMDGFGAAHIPPEVRAAVPPDQLWHTQDDIPDRLFDGQRLLVIGASASAFDVAATALERGAVAVHQIARNPVLAPQFSGGDLRDLVANLRSFRHLSDLTRWESVLRTRARGNAPQQSIDRARNLPGHHLHLGRPAIGILATAGGVSLTLNGVAQNFDHVIAGTGYRQGAHLRAEFAALAPLIRRWGDLGLPCKPEQAHWGDLPYLGEGFELLPAVAGAEWVSRIHVFTFAAILSHGLHVGDVASAAVTVPRLAEHLVRCLFEAARPAHERAARGQEQAVLEKSA